MKENANPRVAVVTGASAGVGRATVRALAARGTSIGLIARGVDGLEAAKQEVEAAGARALVLPLDVADAAAVERAASEVEAELGPIDVWINDAMVSVFSPVKLMTAEEFRRVTEVTYLGYVHGTLAALHRMLPRDHGSIIQVGSALAYRGIPLQAAYCAAKHAIQGFCDSLYTELIHDGSNVRLTMVQMPALNTPQFGWVKTRLPHRAQPVPPIFQPEVAAEAIMYSIDHPRRELYVGWPVFKAIEGNELAPSYADHYLAEHGYESQQTDQPLPADRPDNLWAPVPGDHGAHGAFDARARDHSWFLWANMNRKRLGIATAATAAGLALALFRGRHEHNGHSTQHVSD